MIRTLENCLVRWRMVKVSLPSKIFYILFLMVFCITRIQNRLVLYTPWNGSSFMLPRLSEGLCWSITMTIPPQVTWVWRKRWQDLSRYFSGPTCCQMWMLVHVPSANSLSHPRESLVASWFQSAFNIPGDMLGWTLWALCPECRVAIHTSLCL